MSGYKIKYFGWSSISIESGSRTVVFDPLYSPYCGVQWSSLEDYEGADLVCVTHGHEEHFLDTPEVLRKTGAKVISSKKVCQFLKERNKIPEAQLVPVGLNETVEFAGFKITSFSWKHRDINLPRTITKAAFTLHMPVLKWAWSSLTSSPFYAPFFGFHVELADGTTILNYNEGFNYKMTDEEIREIGRRFKTDVLLGGMQLNFVNDVRRGVAALSPKTVILYPPHEKFHEMMGLPVAPYPEFLEAARKAAPNAQVMMAEPGWSYSQP